MAKHKPISKQKRIEVYKKYNGRCAYCGEQIAYKDMQVDHIKPVYVHSEVRENMTDEEMYDISNLLPACRQCNFYKSTFDIETFRNRLTEVMMKNLQKQFIYKLAIKYGLINENIKPVVFYFEKVERNLADDSSGIK